MLNKKVVSVASLLLSSSVFALPNCENPYKYEKRQVQVCTDITETQQYTYHQCDYSGYLDRGSLIHTPVNYVPWSIFDTSTRFAGSQCDVNLFQTRSESYQFYDGFGGTRWEIVYFDGLLNLTADHILTGTTEVVVGQECHLEWRWVKVVNPDCENDPYLD